MKAVLVNGRISAASLARYRHFPSFFAGLFNSFTFLAMQTGAEVENLAGLGVAPRKLLALGNLKYGALVEGLGQGQEGGRFAGLLRQLAGRTVWVAGSTHPGEEELLLRAYLGLRNLFPELYLVLAPRNPGRAGELARLAERFGLRAELRSRQSNSPGDLLLLDTMGELAQLYGHGELAFVGGSLVEERGHNPLEPAAFGRPVLFGPHMEDFAEIAEEMLAAGAALLINDEAEMAAAVSGWLADPEGRRAAGRKGAELVEARRGVTERHLGLLRLLLDGKGENEFR
ncbi:MAG TPA: glycosyltransferase N-terminal domain-containing protein [Desulfurivibrionaceae bacterium]|nr:glycosyltransferase N-terminal domain-containing protein [Desulfurivibrionaceae bacterium]